jgi:hypothetical protein
VGFNSIGYNELNIVAEKIRHKTIHLKWVKNVNTGN